jgi:signal transduction histidine kinase
MHGGRLKVLDSVIGEGATFEIRFSENGDDE